MTRGADGLSGCPGWYAVSPYHKLFGFRLHVLYHSQDLRIHTNMTFRTRKVPDLPDNRSMVRVLKAHLVGRLCSALSIKKLWEGCGQRKHYKYGYLVLRVSSCSLARTPIFKHRWNTSGLARANSTSQATDRSREATQFPLALSHHRPVSTEWALDDPSFSYQRPVTYPVPPLLLLLAAVCTPPGGTK